MFDSVAKDHSCSGRFCKTILEERGQYFGQHLHCNRRTWTISLTHRRDVYIVIGIKVHVICIQMLIYHDIMYASFCSNSFNVELQAQPKPRNAFHDRQLLFQALPLVIIIMLSVAKRQRLLPSLDCCSPFVSLL